MHYLLEKLYKQRNIIFASDKYFAHNGNVSAQHARFFRICFTAARFNYCVCYCFIACVFVLLNTKQSSQSFCRTFYSSIHSPIALEKNGLFSLQLLFAEFCDKNFILIFLDIIIDIFFK